MRLIEDGHYVQLRVQAKRLDVDTQRYRELAKRSIAASQAERLVRAASRWPAL